MQQVATLKRRSLTVDGVLPDQSYADTTDNVSRVFVHESSSSFTVTIADDDDNVTAQQAITHSKGDATPSLGTASGSVTQKLDIMRTLTQLFTVEKVLLLSATDNGNFNEDGTSVASAIFDTTLQLLQNRTNSDGTNMIGIADNGTNLAVSTSDYKCFSSKNWDNNLIATESDLDHVLWSCRRWKL